MTHGDGGGCHDAKPPSPCVRFFFYANDHEPIHVYVSNGDYEARFKINPIELIENKGLKKKRIKDC